MADYRLLLTQGKQVVFKDDRAFTQLWKDLTANELIELDGELVDGDDRYMGHVGLQLAQVIGLFHELSRGHGGH